MSDQNTLTIKLRLDKSEADAVGKQFAADEKQRQRDLLATVKDAERGKVTAAREASSEASKVKKASTNDEIAAQRALTAEAKRLREEEKAAAKALADANRQAMRDQASAIATAQLGYSALISTVRELGRAATEAGEKSKALTAGFTSQRDSLRELANLMGKSADNQFTIDTAKFNASTGFKPDEGREFLTELYNSGAQYKDKNIKGGEFDQYAQQAGSLAVAKQIDPAIVGDMAGSLLGFTDYNKFGDNASEEALGHLNASLAILGRGKGNANVLARQFSMLASAALNEDEMKGVFQTPEDIGAVASIGAEKHESQAAELAKMAVRGLRGFGEKDKQAGLLKEAKITPQDSFVGALEKLAPVIEQKAKAQGLKTEDVLRQNFEDQGAVDAISVFINKGVLGGGFKDRREYGKTVAGPKPALQTIDNFKESDVGMARQADADVKLAEAERGSENASLETLRKQALAKLIKEKRIDTTGTNMKDYMVGNSSFGLLGSGQQVRIDEEAQRMLIERNGGKDDQTWGDYLNVTPTARESDLRGRMERLQAQGVNPLTGKAAAAKPNVEGERMAAERPAVVGTGGERNEGGGGASGGGGGNASAGADNKTLEKIEAHLDKQTKIMEDEKREQRVSPPALNSPTRPRVTVR